MTVFVGDILNATPATVVANPASTRTWRWLRNGVAIPGFTSTSYRVTGLDTGAPIAVQQVETNLMGSSSAVSVNTANVGAWTPSTIFSASEPGVWYDTDDYTAMFQDAAGTTPVTGAGQPVGLLLDKSRGLVLGPELVTNGDFSSGSTGWTGGTVSGGQVSVPLFSEATQAISLTAGRTYRVSFDINASAGMGRVTVGGTLIDLLNVSRVGGVYYIVTTNTTALRVGCISGTSVSFDNISVKELPGNHATSSGDARPRTVIRPLNAERRNVFERSEEFDNAYWTKDGATVPVTNNIAPDGTATAETLAETATTAVHGTYRVPAGTFVAGTYTLSCYLKQGTTRYAHLLLNTSVGYSAATFDLQDGLVTKNQTGGTGVTAPALPTIVSAGNGWYRATITATTNSAINAVGPLLSNSGTPTYTASGGVSYAGSTSNNILIWGAQLEAGSTATAYQRVVTTNEWYDPAVSSYRGLFFDGVDDFLVTPTITPGTDKVQVFAGARKLSDAAAGFLANFGHPYNSGNGSFTIGLSRDTNIELGGTVRGTVYNDFQLDNAAYAAPITGVYTTLADIVGDTVSVRWNAISVISDTNDNGTGNFSANPLYIGRLTGTSFPFIGILTSLVVRFGANLSTSNINRAEYYVSEKTGVTLT